ncbi:hypothetical protein SF06_20210 [Pseudomonas flexibilis]|nr:hypothetical protein SF06_20210 [Pseudomonas flexibilis]
MTRRLGRVWQQMAEQGPTSGYTCRQATGATAAPFRYNAAPSSQPARWFAPT